MKVKHKAKQTLVDLYHYDALFAKNINKINDSRFLTFLTYYNSDLSDENYFQQIWKLDFNAYQMNKDFNKMFDLYVTYNWKQSMCFYSVFNVVFHLRCTIHIYPMTLRVCVENMEHKAYVQTWSSDCKLKGGTAKQYWQCFLFLSYNILALKPHFYSACIVLRQKHEPLM